MNVVNIRSGSSGPTNSHLYYAGIDNTKQGVIPCIWPQNSSCKWHFYFSFNKEILRKFCLYINYTVASSEDVWVFFLNLNNLCKLYAQNKLWYSTKKAKITVAIRKHVILVTTTLLYILYLGILSLSMLLFHVEDYLYNLYKV